MANVLLKTDNRGVATLTLNRPDKHNAFDEHLIAELSGVLTDIAGNDSIRVVVLGANGKSFCAGADLDWMRRMAGYDHAANLADAAALAEMLHKLDTLPQPTIARIQGTAMGGGAGLVCCCDMAVAVNTATFAFSEVRLGLIPGTISPYVVRAMGRRAARRYFLTAEKFDADTAQQMGMVSEAVDPVELDATVERLVQNLLDGGPRAVRNAKQLINDVAGREIDDELRSMTSRRIADIRGTPEGQEGLSAFLNKRPPAWKK
jgi:methylglutaconyl-CoA hydratase